MGREHVFGSCPRRALAEEGTRATAEPRSHPCQAEVWAEVAAQSASGSVEAAGPPHLVRTASKTLTPRPLVLQELVWDLPALGALLTGPPPSSAVASLEPGRWPLRCRRPGVQAGRRARPAFRLEPSPEPQEEPAKQQAQRLAREGRGPCYYCPTLQLRVPVRPKLQSRVAGLARVDPG